MASYGQIDLSRQVAEGAAVALGILSGGTGRVDGRALGMIHRAINNDPNNATIPAGALVTVMSGLAATGTAARCKLAYGTDYVVGLALAAAAPATGGTSGAFDMLTFGLHPSVLSTGTIHVGDLVYPSGALGYCTATRPFGAIPIGYALSEASGTSTVAVWFDPTPAAFALEHGRLRSVGGIQRHTDLLEAVPDASWAMTPATGLDLHGSVQDLHDRSDASYFNQYVNTSWYVDLGAGVDLRFKAAALRISIASTAFAQNKTLTIDASNDLSSWATITSAAISIGGVGTPISNPYTWATPGTAYRYWRFTISSHSGATSLYNVELYEASGQYLYVSNPAGGTSLLDAAISGTNIGRGFYFMMGGS